MPPALTFTNKMNPNIITKGDDFNDDATVAKILAEEEKYNHTVVEITPKNIKETWNDAIYFMEQPAYNPSLAMYCHTNKVLHDAGIVVTMSGDMGDEILGGYPKYWKVRNPKYLKRHLNKNKIRIRNWNDVMTLCMARIKRPLVAHGGYVINTDKQTVHEEMLKLYPDDLWNPKDPVASYMALDCVTQVPEEFFNRNDKFGMAYGMEGRFPLATKMFMQYCMNIHSNEKIGKNKNDTKLLTKIAYKKKLHSRVINKYKTGWTVPLQHWWKKTSKADIPAMIVKDWIKTYKIKI